MDSLFSELILRNLDVLTNEETLLKEISNVSNIPIQSCQIARDSLTNLSRGICYLEMKNVLEAIKLYNALTAATLNIEGRKGSVILFINLDDNPTYHNKKKHCFYCFSIFSFSKCIILQTTFRKASNPTINLNSKPVGSMWSI